MQKFLIRSIDQILFLALLLTATIDAKFFPSFCFSSKLFGRFGTQIIHPQKKKKHK